MKAAKHGLKYIFIFSVTVAVLAGLLVLSAKIPQSAIKENVQESAEYLCDGELFGLVVDGARGSQIDRYADSILLAIAYQYDEDHPLRSVMWSAYYYEEHQNENENLLEAVTNDRGANQQYMRYWHGSIAIVRPLLVFFSLPRIYLVNGVILAVLVIWLMIILLKNRLYTPAIGVTAGLVLTAFWFVPLSLEYTWTYLLMLLLSIIGVRLALRGKWNCLGIFFLIGGIVTNYLDFLTTETLTLTVPLLLILWVDIHRNGNVSGHSLLPKAGKAALVWGFGYVGMWVMKWVLAAIVLQENVMPYISEHIEERIGGNIGIGLGQYIMGAVLNNVKCLFPFGYGVGGMFAGMALILFAAYIGYVYHRKHICREHILLYALTGLLPYIRYIVLHNHSYLHCFFTYRAQMATVLAVVLILEELTDWRLITHENDGRGKS
ncbi:MAG: hypothetical protein ACI4SD_00855 [Suilimivivens sp.]